jgi:hypothetical protein
MSDGQRLMTELHQAFSLVVGASSSLPDQEISASRLRLMQQAYQALHTAFAQQDIAIVAQALGHLLDTVYDTALECGLEVTPVLRDSHHVNRSGVYTSATATAAEDAPPTRRATVSDTATARHEPTPPPQAASARRHHHPYVRCPRCHKNFVRRSRRIGVLERLQSWIRLYPFRCEVCGHRFRAFLGQTASNGPRVERRQHRRLPVYFPATFVEIVHLNEQHTGQGTVTDLALGGCYLQTPVRLPQNSVLSLEIRLAPEAPALTIDAAVVRHAGPTGVGIAFLRLGEAEQARFTQYIGQLMAQQPMLEAEDEHP